MIHQAFCPNTPQQNRVAERENRILLEISRALLIESHAPAHFWPEAIAMATYLTIVFLPNPKLQNTSRTLGSFVSLPSHHSLPPCIFGCVVFVHLSKHSQTKLEPRAIKCVFVVDGVHQKGYRCFDLIHNRLYTTMDCDFFEDTFYFTQPSSQEESVSDDLSWLLHLIPPIVLIWDQKYKYLELLMFFLKT